MGKSSCCRHLVRLCPDTVIFDADRCVADLYRCSVVLEELQRAFGEEVLLVSGSVNKDFLRQRVFKSVKQRRVLEQVFHPRVRQECLDVLRETDKKHTSRLFVADIPLLFEGGFDFGQSANLLLATSYQTQATRLKDRNGWDDETIESVIDSQMPMIKKMKLADAVLWNEGPEEMLILQCRRYLEYLGIRPRC